MVAFAAQERENHLSDNENKGGLSWPDVAAIAVVLAFIFGIAVLIKGGF